MTRIILSAILLCIASASGALATGMDQLTGKWVSSLPVAGQDVTFSSDLGNYSTRLPGFESLVMISKIDGHNGAQLKIVSEMELICYYSVQMSNNDMQLEQRDGGSKCPAKIELKRSK